MIKKHILFVLSVLLLLQSFHAAPAKAEVIIYENVSTSIYKTIRIDDSTNFKYLNDYPYVVYIDGQFYGTFHKDQDILVPDNTSVLIYVPSPVKSDFGSSYDLGKSILGMGFFFFLGIGLLIIAAVYVIKYVWRRN